LEKNDVRTLTQERNNLNAIPQETIESIRLAIRVEDFVSERIELHRSGKVFVGSCPWHQSKSGRSFVVYPDQQTWRCWGCAVGGDVFSFFIRFAGISFPAAVRFVARSADIEIDSSPCEEVNEQFSARTELGQIEKQISEILNAEFLRAARDLDRTNRMQIRAGFRLEDLSTGGAGRFFNESEFCWSALELAAAVLPRLDAEYVLLAFGKSAERERFVLADADGRNEIINELLTEGCVLGDGNYLWEVPAQ
jgi:hypothetical protein